MRPRYFAIAFILVLACALAGGPAPAQEGGGEAVLRATGRGSAPAGRSGAQARALARRAATVDAYRSLLRQLGEYSGRLEKGTGHISVDGYIRGAYVDEVRYYQDGSVEVVLGLDAKLKGGMKSVPGAAGEAGSGAICEVEKPGTVITEEEWELLKAEVR